MDLYTYLYSNMDMLRGTLRISTQPMLAAAPAAVRCTSGGPLHQRRSAGRWHCCLSAFLEVGEEALGSNLKKWCG